MFFWNCQKLKHQASKSVVWNLRRKCRMMKAYIALLRAYSRNFTCVGVHVSHFRQDVLSARQKCWICCRIKWKEILAIVTRMYVSGNHGTLMFCTRHFERRFENNEQIWDLVTNVRLCFVRKINLVWLCLFRHFLKY